MPMNKANLKNILTAVRDMINRSRIAYKDYLGEETVTETKALVEGTLSETYSPLILKDPSFTEFVVGEGYEVTIDGATQTLTAISDSGAGVITNAIDLDHPGENYFIVDFLDNQVMGEAGGTYIGKTISISQTKTTTTKKYDIKKVPQELIPDTIARSADVAKVKTKADDAFYQANTAQTTADNAQTAANSAQAAADINKEALDCAFSSVATFTFDKQTSGRDKLGFNGYYYYKISDFNPAPENVTSFKGTRESGAELSRITIGNNCVEYGLFIIVASAGVCSLPITETDTMSFTAPSAGLYARYTADYPIQTAGTGEFTLRESTGSFSITGLLLKSSTTGSTKKFKITVDDTGTLSATEVTA